MGAGAECSLICVLGKVRKAYVTGGKSAVSEAVVSELRSMGISVTRVAGTSRQATSFEAAKLLPNPESVVVATGAGFADASSIEPWCYWTSAPILLTGKNGKLTDDQLTWLGVCGVKSFVVVGGIVPLPDATMNATLGILQRTLFLLLYTLVTLQAGGVPWITT